MLSSCSFFKNCTDIHAHSAYIAALQTISLAGKLTVATTCFAVTSHYLQEVLDSGGS